LAKRIPRSRAGSQGIRDPMAYNTDILLGTITKVHGYEGAVTVRLEKTFTENIPDLESVFLEIEGKPVPFFISESDYPGGNILRLKFEGYESVGKIAEFTGCRIFLTADKDNSDSSESIRDLTGYNVHLKDNSFLGVVLNLIENPGQLLLNINTETGKQILIPLHDDLIVKIDKNKGIITMDLPEGLIDLN
jgi:16S rRNA processing protein RimM